MLRRLPDLRYLGIVGTQVDARTGEPHETLPGAPLGWVNWTDRSR